MDKLYTVKEIADLLQVSKPTVQRAINAAGIEADKEDNKHSRFYSVEKARQIILSINADFDVASLAKQTDTSETFGETSPQTPQNDATQSETPPQTGDLELVKAMLTTLQGQLAAKDKQIAALEEQLVVKDRQINDYSARLAEAMELTKGQQYISAAEKVERIAAAQAAPENEEVIIPVEPVQGEDTPAPPDGKTEQPPQKKSFWQRLIGR
jgi:excisionase family DNA binding protein